MALKGSPAVTAPRDATPGVATQIDNVRQRLEAIEASVGLTVTQANLAGVQTAANSSITAIQKQINTLKAQIAALQTATGIPGPSGSIGAPGDPGEDGDIGPPGVQGIPGIPGIQGAAGIDGLDAEEPILIPGPVGSTGPSGSQGIPGSDGEDGQDGLIMVLPIPGPAVAFFFGACDCGSLTGAVPLKMDMGDLRTTASLQINLSG